MRTTATYTVKVQTHYATVEYTFLGAPTLDEVREAIKEEIGVLQLDPDFVIGGPKITPMLGLLELLSITSHLLLPDRDSPRRSEVNDVVQVAGTTIGWINIKATRTFITERGPQSNEYLAA
jgi:hypothetical protein